VFQRDGSWYIGYPLGNGKYRREKVGTSHALAKDLYAKRLAEVAERRFFPGRVTNAKKFQELADRYWELHGRHLRSRSWKAILADACGRFGQMKVGDIGSADVQRYYNEILARSSAGTANRYLTLVKSVFNKGKSWGEFHGDNPCDPIKKQREPNHRLRYLSLQEIERLMLAAHPRLRPVVAAAIMTGMRKGELLGLTWANVDLERGTIFILQSKSGRPREIPIAAALKAILIELGPDADGAVFALPEIMLRRYFSRALREAQIEAFRWHDLRHTFASHFLMRTGDLPTLQRLLGHSTPLLTMRYAHLSREHQAAGMATFEAGLPSMGKNILNGPS